MNESLKYKFYMPSDCLSGQTLFDYIDKKLSHKEQHLVEKHLMDCEFCSDALEGLQLLKNRNRIHSINKLVDAKIAKKADAKIILLNFRTITSIAAALVLLIGGVFFLKYFLVSNNESSMAELKEETAATLYEPPPPPTAVMEEVAAEKSLEQEIVTSSNKDSFAFTSEISDMISTDKEKDELRENMPVQFKEKEQLKKGTKDNQVGYFQRSQNLAKKPGNSVSSTVAATQTATGTYNYAAAPVADAKVTTITSGEDADATILNDKKKEGKYKEVAATTPKVIADDNIKTEKNDGFVSGNTQNGADKSENNRFVNNNSANNTNVPVTLNKNAESSKKTTESDDNQRTRTLAGKTDLEKTNLKISSKNNKSKSRAKFASPQKAVPAYAQKVEAFDREKPKKDELDYRKDEQSELAKNKLSETVATKTEALTETAVIGGTAESQTKESAVNEVPILADETTLASGLTNVDSVYTAVDEMPQYPGGDSELLKYFKNNIKQSEGKNESSTKMYVQFTINKNGKAVNPNVLKNTDKELEKSVIDAVNKMPAWKPGKQNGKVVDVKYSLPIQVSGN